MTISLGHAQESATQQQIDKLSGQIQDLLDAQATQNKRLDEIEKRLNELSDKLDQPATKDYASNADLKKLAAQMQEIEQKRQADRNLVLKQLKELTKIVAPPPPKHKPVTSS